MADVSKDYLFYKAQRFCGWAGVVAVTFFIIGGMILGGMLPPLISPDDPPAEFARKVSENVVAIRIGSVFLIFSFAMFAALAAGIAAQTRRFEKAAAFSYLQLMFGACGTAVAVLVAFSWALMAFRPGEYDPTVVQFLIDFAYFLALFSVPVFSGWCLVIALPILFAKEGEEPFPRWVAFFNLWAAVLYAPGQMILFFKSGIFSWSGIVALWIPFTAFFLWILVMSWGILKGAQDARG